MESKNASGGTVPGIAEPVTTAAMLARLVGFDTTSRNPNLELIGFVREWLDRHGVPYRVSTDPSGGKANIHAIIGPQVAGAVVKDGISTFAALHLHPQKAQDLIRAFVEPRR